MPISGFRSAASITNIITTRRTPAPIEKRPSTRKNVARKLPAFSASWTAVAFVSLTSSWMLFVFVRLFISASTLFTSSSELCTPPAAETTTLSSRLTPRIG
jgi:hypothetical protein